MLLTMIIKHSIRYLAAVLSATFLTGCYETFNPEIDTKPVLCINSLITAGMPIDINISHTWVFNDTASEKNHEVSDAVVSIIANGQIKELDYIPQEGDEIQIKAQSATYGEASADVTVPYSAPVGQIKVMPIVTSIRKDIDYNNISFAEIRFNLKIEIDVIDPPGADNYYKCGYYSFYNSTQDDEYQDSEDAWLHIGELDYDSEPIFKEHVGVFETIMGNGEDTSFLFFTDRQFSGSTYTLHLNFFDNVFYIKTDKYDESLLECGLDINLNTVSGSYYNWAVYKWNISEGINGELSDIGLSNPIWGYSNVSTGAGVVAAMTENGYTINLKDFILQALNSIEL